MAWRAGTVRKEEAGMAPPAALPLFYATGKVTGPRQKKIPPEPSNANASRWVVVVERRFGRDMIENSDQAAQRTGASYHTPTIIKLLLSCTYHG
jgi:hypothetical protein